MLTVREAAAILRVGRNQLYQAIAHGELHAIRIGRAIRIPKQALLDLLAPAAHPSPSPSPGEPAPYDQDQVPTQEPQESQEHQERL